MKGCRLGYCAVKNSRYEGGGTEALSKGLCPICGGKLEQQPETERADYDSKKEKTLGKVAATLEECLGQFHGEEDNRIREDIANYTVGYLGVSFGLHIKR